MGTQRDEEEIQVAKFLLKNPKFLEKYLITHATSPEALDEVTEKLKELCKDDTTQNQPAKMLSPSYIPSPSTPSDGSGETSPSVVPRSSRKSVTSDLFHQWLTSNSNTVATNYSTKTSPTSGMPQCSSSGHAGSKDMELLEQNDRLMELILDISNELDINVLCHKILLNVGHLTKADRCSLFLARGPRDNRYLEAKLFDVDATTSKLFFLKKVVKERKTCVIRVSFQEHRRMLQHTYSRRAFTLTMAETTFTTTFMQIFFVEKNGLGCFKES